MKLGYNEATCMMKSSLEQDLTLCEKYGYDIIEVRFDALERYLEHHSLKELKGFLERSHLSAGALNAIEPINFLDEKGMEALCAKIKRGCEIAKEIGAPGIIVVASNYGEDIDDYTDEEISADTVCCFRKLLPIAEEYEVKLALEPVGGSKFYVHSLKQAWDIVKEIDSPYVGIALDAFNIYLHDGHRDIDVLREIPVEKIFAYHLNDGEDRPIEELDHCHRTMPGDGVFDLKKITGILREKGYEGSAAIELFRPQYWEMEPEDVIKLGAEKAKDYL